MKMFNKNRRSFVNNNHRRHDRNTGYRSNDRNNKFGRKSGGRNKFMKSEQFHEEEDATPWHVMKQNLKPSISIKNPEIEDDWNADEKLKCRAAKQEFMRQKDERYRKFVIENERKTVSKWDSFSDIEQNEDEGMEITYNSNNAADEEQIFEVVEQIEDNISVGKMSKKNKFETGKEAQSSKKVNINRTNPRQEIVTENEINQSLLVKKKTKKKFKQSESQQDLVVETKIESMVTMNKLKTTVMQSELPQEIDIDTKTDHTLIAKKEIMAADSQFKDVEEIVQPMLVKKKSKKNNNYKFKQVELHTDEGILDDLTDHIVQERIAEPNNENNFFYNEQPEETFLESLASKKHNEALLFENTEVTKSGPRCFACRQFGHSLKQCRDFDNKSTRICIKCGSSEHAYQNCTVHKGRVFKFASCFICKQTGHISSQCKEKKNGVYPDGGNCRYCSSVDHLGFNCPRRPGRKKKRKFLNKRNPKTNDKLRKVQTGDGRGGSSRVQKYPKDNKIKRNFK